MQEDKRLIYHLNLARHSMMKHLDIGTKSALGISATQLTALMTLKKHNGLLMKDLATILMLDKSAVTGLAKRMQANGLILRTRHESDARASLLTITDKGEHLISEGVGLLKAFNVELTDGFSEQEMEVILRFLNHVTAISTN
ncbi:MarR family winged helix-turn-helix transcriptional regulator [Alteromonas stellipolaris]|jgi:DNA-binding MarR family transcriptional regulator|uniref:MarR family winged helix-turn-helix transcriptional regulator n=1 Tax=Alteromonas stellipolaris TaxID=233316 RepID=UPI0027354CCA|nr:MarR family transcriptional regulator [Alteromonas stellipolaris]MDP2537112.1 MarR family transcriptional regulator [Alteromonas stellipolaris]